MPFWLLRQPLAEYSEGPKENPRGWASSEDGQPRPRSHQTPQAPEVRPGPSLGAQMVRVGQPFWKGPVRLSRDQGSIPRHQATLSNVCTCPLSPDPQGTIPNPMARSGSIPQDSQTASSSSRLLPPRERTQQGPPGLSVMAWPPAAPGVTLACACLLFSGR